MSEEKQSADILIEFLKAAGGSGSAVKQIEELQNKIALLKEIEQKNKIHESNITQSLRENKFTEQNIMKIHSDILSEQDHLELMKKEFAAEKTKVKIDKEYAEALNKSIEHKIAESEAKLKRLALAEESVIGSELKLHIEKQKIDVAFKQIKKIMDEIQ